MSVAMMDDAVQKAGFESEEVEFRRRFLTSNHRQGRSTAPSITETETEAETETKSRYRPVPVYSL